MRELGHRGGKSRRKGVAEQLPEAERESLRQHLQANLDHSAVVKAVQRLFDSLKSLRRPKPSPDEEAERAKRQREVDETRRMQRIDAHDQEEGKKNDAT